MTNSIPVNPHDLYGDHTQGEPAPAMDMLTARMAALQLLDQVLGQRHTLDQALQDSRDFNALPARDRAFCRMIASTVLRRLGQIDDLISKAEERPGEKPLTLHNILRMGVAQILFMAVPDHAAVDTAVKLTDAVELDRQKGFVNAMLRTMTRAGKEWLARQDEARLNTPEWLLKIWIEDYGLGTAAQIAKANLAEAPLDITIKDESERAYWSTTLKTVPVGAGTLRRTGGGAVHDLPGYDDGAWWIQDASAAMPARLLGDIEGKTVVDLCAAPGGKTLQLAALGARVIALDRSAQRLRRLEENLQRNRLQQNVEIIAADAGEWRPKEPPHFILLDAPCTATGTARRHPDVLHLKSPRDLASLVDVQARILANAFDILAPGGTLVYCVCSLQKAEGEAQIERLFTAREDAIKRPIRAEEIGGLEEVITEFGDARVLPFHLAALGGMDGFFISRMTKMA